MMLLSAVVKMSYREGPRFILSGEGSFPYSNRGPLSNSVNSDHGAGNRLIVGNKDFFERMGGHYTPVYPDFIGEALGMCEKAAMTTTAQNNVIEFFQIVSDSFLGKTRDSQVYDFTFFSDAWCVVFLDDSGSRRNMLLDPDFGQPAGIWQRDHPDLVTVLQPLTA